MSRDEYKYRQSSDYRGVNFDAAEKARDARYRNPHSIAFSDIPKKHRFDFKGNFLQGMEDAAYGNPFGVNPNVLQGKPRQIFSTTSNMSRDLLQTLYGNIIPPAPYLRKYDQYFDPSQNLFERGIGAMVDDIKDSRTIDLLKFFFFN